MKPERLKYWADIFDYKALEYELAAKGVYKDEAFVRDAGRDFVEQIAKEFGQKAERAGKVAAKLRLRISN